MSKIKELLEKAEHLLITSAFMESSDADDCLGYVSQALELLKQQPPTGEFEEWFAKEYPLPPTVERGPVGRNLKNGCKKAWKAAIAGSLQS